MSQQPSNRSSQDVPRKLDRKFLQTSRLLGYWQVFINVFAHVLLLVLAASTESWIAGFFIFLGIGLTMHRLFFPTHDCLHYSLFPTKKENTLCGILMSGLIGTTFDAIRIQHMEHHRDLGKPEDPGAGDYFVRFSGRRQLLAFLLLPLFGSIFIEKVTGYLSHMADSTVREKYNPSGFLHNHGALIVIQLIVCAILTQGFDLSQLWRYPLFGVLPLITVFLFMIRLRMFLEHGSLNYNELDYLAGAKPITRTIYASWLEQIFLCGSDFNYHHEHHLYPVVPGRCLAQLHKEMIKDNPHPDFVKKTYVQALKELWDHLATTPARANGS